MGDSDAPTTSLSMKGIGESGTVGSTPAVSQRRSSTRSRPTASRHVDLPCNGENVWKALQEATA